MKKVKNSIKSEIPKEIKIVFGKFYIFSIFIFILLLMYPFFIMKYISIYSNVAIVIVLPVLYLLMIIDIVRKREVYRSSLFPLFIIFFLLTYVFTIVKFISFA